ncbi:MULTISPECIES: GNAT family N-acetyltransferase [Streptomyces]|uniref:GNAT family N-acetyltransferase n=1 Tax=Streptomyces koelreuteriae TaxID=2838015 RepID=A0ABX8FP48_9ACTN|nr:MULTISPECIES: GNAT family N-acetyltransferase [Streptomyces]QWB22897.1 GNAT family N-acetyltransferase [Streptomyces koelreuteriae]UUA05844.1 GNAT family N-acetyltransferase [Streptomyces koelreuteriae]UUA13472.1 GNAT family N-acetyltransferase [Streptomyces sp. CRCS-T-1]
MTIRVRTAHTADLAPAELAAVRALLDAAFEGDFGDDDWDHGLGGMHALVHDDSGLAAHGAVVMRRVGHRGRWLRAGYVENVAVRSDARRRGLGGRIMGELERVVERAYDLGALSASDDGARLYTSRGWRLWSGEVHALSPREGDIRLPDEEDSTYVRPALAGALDPAHALLFDWRDGDVL